MRLLAILKSNPAGRLVTRAQLASTRYGVTQAQVKYDIAVLLKAGYIKVVKHHSINGTEYVVTKKGEVK